MVDGIASIGNFAIKRGLLVDQRLGGSAEFNKFGLSGLSLGGESSESIRKLIQLPGLHRLHEGHGAAGEFFECLVAGITARHKLIERTLESLGTTRRLIVERAAQLRHVSRSRTRRLSGVGNSAVELGQLGERIPKIRPQFNCYVPDISHRCVLVGSSSVVVRVIRLSAGPEAGSDLMEDHVVVNVAVVFIVRPNRIQFSVDREQREQLLRFRRVLAEMRHHDLVGAPVLELFLKPPLSEPQVQFTDGQATDLPVGQAKAASCNTIGGSPPFSLGFGSAAAGCGTA